MATIKFTVNTRGKGAKAFLEFVKTLPFVSMETSAQGEKSPYDPEFVEKIKDAEASKNRTRINPDNVWESL